MKCITILEPYALCAVLGLKPWENRSWMTGYRGNLLIQAGKSLRMLDSLNDAEADQLIVWCRNNGVRDPNAMLRPGEICGIVAMVGCKPADEARKLDPANAHWITGPYCHQYKKARRFKKGIPYRGQQGLFEVPDELVLDAIAEVTP